MTPRALLSFAALAAITFAACSSDDEGDSSDTTTAEAETPPVCDQLRVISDFDTQSAEIIATAQQYEVLKDFLVEAGPAVANAYGEVAELEPSLEEDVVILRDVTNATIEAAADATSLPELSAVLLANPNTTAAGEAGLRLNTFAEKNCGFSTGNN